MGRVLPATASASPGAAGFQWGPRAESVSLAHPLTGVCDLPVDPGCKSLNLALAVKGLTK